jgi:hypothetical protein
VEEKKKKKIVRGKLVKGENESTLFTPMEQLLVFNAKFFELVWAAKLTPLQVSFYLQHQLLLPPTSTSFCLQH